MTPAGTSDPDDQGGPFGRLLDARADQIQDRVALEVCEDRRMAGMSHYRIWDDGSTEHLPSARDGIVFPPPVRPLLSSFHEVGLVDDAARLPSAHADKHALVQPIELSR